MIKNYVVYKESKMNTDGIKVISRPIGYEKTYEVSSLLSIDEVFRFKKKGGSCEFIRISPSSLKRFNLDENFVWGIDIDSGSISKITSKHLVVLENDPRHFPKTKFREALEEKKERKKERKRTYSLFRQHIKDYSFNSKVARMPLQGFYKRIGLLRWFCC